MVVVAVGTGHTRHRRPTGLRHLEVPPPAIPACHAPVLRILQARVPGYRNNNDIHRSCLSRELTTNSPADFVGAGSGRHLPEFGPIGWDPW